MIDWLKPYPEYKQTDSTWLGVIPSHWEDVPLGRVLVQRIEQNRPIKTREILSLSLRQGVIPYSEKKSGGNKAKSDLSAYTLAYPGDIVLNSMNVVVGSVGLSKYYGAVSPVYYVLRTRNKIDLIEYFDAIFQDKSFQQSLWGLGNGIMFLQSKTTGKFNTIRLRIPMSKLRRVVIPLPPPDEQGAIVKFLDYANGKIERAIRAKRKLIGLLNEQKQAIIHRAVTRGLEPNVKLKPSGIPWLGDVPEHWEVVALRRRYDQCLGKMLDAKRVTGRHLVPYLRNTDVQWDKINTKNLPSMDIKDHELARYTVQRGDLLVCEGGDVGRCAFWNGELIVCGFQKAIHRLRPLQPDRDCPRFQFYLMFLASKTGVFLADGSVSTIPHLTGDKLRAHRFVYPPSIEQEAISQFLDSELGVLSNVIWRTESEIAFLREYRTTLTAEVVTGKLDVREAAKRLPDQAVESLPADESLDDLVDDEITDEVEA
jgi:type I restriction enzyme S subunit